MGQSDKKSSREEQREKIKEGIRSLNSEDLIYIPARQQLPVTAQTPKKRVCAYCRVSTDDPAQTTSYELQKEHYEEEINKNPEWIFAGIYADEGISATSMKHRDNFNRMIADCEAGKIDVIVTKSVSRFARNVVDCLSMVRHLSAMKPPVAVKFETEGINTLDSTSEMILAVMAAAAQEESKTKSNAMNWSLEKRFEKGKFLTPVLIGYDHDEDGKLVINHDEAQTVRLMYLLYLSGFPTTEIAQILMDLKRKTKLGNTKWSSNTVRNVMQNERNCGNVLSWKTFTYDFWEHKKRKNDQDKPQVLKVDHHDAIVSHEIYDAVQLKLASDKYSRNGMPLPALEVIEDGILKGYVSVNRLWSGFSGKDYEEACNSVYSSGYADSCDIDESVCLDDEKVSDNAFTLEGYTIVRSKFFASSTKPLMTIAKGQVKFNSICLKKFENVEYVELLFNSVEKCIAVRPCCEDNPNAIKWGKLKESKWVISPKSCSGFAGPLYSMMSWEADCGYKFCGQYISDGQEQLLIFDLSEPEITRYEKVEIEETEETAEQSGGIKTIIRKILLLSDIWDVSSQNAFSDRSLRLKLAKYKDNWMIMQPVSVYKICGDMTEEYLHHIIKEGRQLLQNLTENTVRGGVVVNV